jgi:protein transport protein SEC13
MTTRAAIDPYVSTTTAAVAAAESTSSGPIYVDTQHEDLVHDAQMDFYGSKLATCSSGKQKEKREVVVFRGEVDCVTVCLSHECIPLSFIFQILDRTIKIYNISETSYELSATIQAHEGPVWQVSWAHPKFGVVLASCSFDGSVLIHRENRPGDWSVLHAARHLHDSSVNAVAVAPPEFGLMVAAASSDGRVSILQHQANQQWSVEYLNDCPTGVNAVAWAPHGAYYDPDQPDAEESPRIVTAGCDNHIRFWVYSHAQGQWELESTTASSSSPHHHSDWVRDVAWAPGLLPNQNTVASCSEDRTVLIWKQQGGKDGEWKATLLHTFDDPVWRVSWSVTGHLLAVSSGDSTVTLWKAGLDQKWTQVETTE